MGEIRRKLPEPSLQNSALDAALDRWKVAFEKAKDHRVAQGSAAEPGLGCQKAASRGGALT